MYFVTREIAKHDVPCGEIPGEFALSSVDEEGCGCPSTP